MEVLLYPHPKLRAANLTVTDFDENLASFATELFEVMYETDGIGLAAPQVGVNVRVMVYNPTGEASEKDQEVVLVNPRVSPTHARSARALARQVSPFLY